MELLKPCPFCGGRADIRYSFDKALIECTNTKCKIQPSTWLHVETDSVNKLVKIWNTRKLKECWRVKTKDNPEMPMVPKAYLKNVEHQRDQYKAERDSLIDDIAVLKANISRLERENEKQLELLQDFSKFINYKLIVSPASDTYKHYRSELDKWGVK